MFEFNEQNKQGKAGEQFIIDNYPSKLAISEEVEYDLIELASNRLIEVKADSYDMNKTPNFFVETVSNHKKMTLGGPFRSDFHKIDIFIYLFIKNKVWFEFTDVKELAKRCKSLIDSDKYEMKEIQNPYYVTRGYCLPRNEFKDLYQVVKIK